MDFAEFSDIETVGFVTYCQNLQKQFQENIQKEMVSIHKEHGDSVAHHELYKAIPVVSHSMQLYGIVAEGVRLGRGELPDKPSKSIFAHVTTKFNETIDHIGKYVHVIQGKLTTAEKELEVKQITINSLTAELDQMKEVFLAPEENNAISNVKRLKYELRRADVSNVQLQKKLKACEDNLQRKFTFELNRIKAQNERKILEHQETINKIIKRNRELQDKLNEKSNADDLYNITQATTWIADAIAQSLGLKDVVTFTKNFGIVVKNLYRGVVILLYAYTFYHSANNYMYWLRNSWKPLNTAYALSVIPIMLFCMIKLAGF